MDLNKIQQTIQNYINFENMTQSKKQLLDIEFNDDVYYSLTSLKELMREYKNDQRVLKSTLDALINNEVYELCEGILRCSYLAEREFVRLVATYNLEKELTVDQRDDIYNEILKIKIEVFGDEK